jgi:hypothetical protein
MPNRIRKTALIIVSWFTLWMAGLVASGMFHWSADFVIFVDVLYTGALTAAGLLLLDPEVF